jgi:hypothetical protein
LNAPELPPGLGLPEAPLFAPRYDAPAIPLLEARDRLFAFPAGMTGASPLGTAFGPEGLHSPMMAVADLPFRTSGVSGGPGSTPGGSTPGSSGGPGGGGVIPGTPTPEPSSVALIALGLAIAMLRLARRAQRSFKPASFSSR